MSSTTVQSAAALRSTTIARTELDFLAGGGEMGERTRSLDWASTLVGPVEEWPPGLRAAVSICLGSRHPMVLWWGRQAYTQFYNDAYISFLGSKHPDCLGRSGRDCWSEIWPVIGPMLEGVYATGDATWSEDLLLVLDRHLLREEAYFTFSYSPIRDEEGTVAGIFCACNETTARVLGERRLKSLRDLNRVVADGRTADSACTVAAQILRDNPGDVPFALIYLLSGHAEQARLVATVGVDTGGIAAPVQIDLQPRVERGPAWPLARALETGTATLVPDAAERFGPLPGGLWQEPSQRALIVPIGSPGQAAAAGFLVVGLSPRRVFDDDYRSYLDLLAGHLGTAIASARAHEEERRRVEVLAELDRAKTTFFSNVSHEFRTPLTLMLGPVEEAVANPAVPGQQRVGASAGARILLADDNSDMRAYVRDLLSPFYHVKTVCDGAEALEAARSWRPDLILSDVMMPRLDGIALLKALRSEEALRHIPIVLLSARAGEESRVEGLNAGADDYLIKPFTARELMARVGALIELTRMRRENEARFHAFVSATSDVIYRMSPDWGEMHHLEGRDVLASTRGPSRGWLDRYIDPADQPTLMSAIHAAMGSKSIFQLEHRVRRADGTFGYLFSRAVPLLDAHGEIMEWMGAASDVTARRETEQALRERDEQLRLATDVAEIGLWDVDAVNGTLFWPPRVKAMFGISPGVPVSMADFYAGLHPEDRQRTTEAYQAALDPAQRAVYDVEYRTVGKEDGLIRWVAAKGRGIFDGSGRCMRVIGTAINITTRKRAEERVREETRVQEVLGKVSQALVAAQLDIQRVIQIATDAATELSGAAFGAFFYNAQDERGEAYTLYTLSGAPREAFAGCPEPRNTAVFGPTYRGEGVVRSEDITRDPRYGHNEPFRGMPDGHLPVRSYLAVPVKSGAGRVIGALLFGHPEPGMFDGRAERLVVGIAAQAGVALDNAQLHQAAQSEVRERRRIEASLDEANRRKDEFLAMLAHELRNPLAPIRNASELLSRTAGEDRRSQDAVGMIRRQTMLLTRLVDDLLDVSRITQGRIQLRRRSVEISTAINQAVETVEPQLRDKRQRLAVTTRTHEPLFVLVDFTRLVQCVGNILTNAIKYTEPDGQISICARADEHDVFIEISDTGMGIGPELLPRVFDLFVQGERALDRSQGGLGIGLAVVKRLIEMHEGDVTARSEGLGRGSVFEIRLPRIARPLPAAAQEATFRAQPQRVLIVDDNADAADSLSMLLAAQGHETQVAYSPRAALACAGEFRPDVALLDIGLPEMDGYELARQLRSVQQLERLRLVALTGYGQAEDHQRALDAGFDGHLVKPVDLSALEHTLAG